MTRKVSQTIEQLTSNKNRDSHDALFNTNAIGLFDSGVGGLSVWQEVVRQLPHESTIYVADSANCPYGFRSAEEVRELSTIMVRFLLNQHCKLIVVACNTASAAALAYLRDKFTVPIVGMEPALKPAAEATRSGHVGVLATNGTFQGTLFKNTTRRYAHGVEVHEQVGEGLVEQVEAGQLDTPETELLLRRYLTPMLAAQVDQIVLGCTHYPLLRPLIEKIVGQQAKIIDPSPAVARQVQRVLTSHNLAANESHLPNYQFYSTGHPQALQDLVTVISPKSAQVKTI